MKRAIAPHADAQGCTIVSPQKIAHFAVEVKRRAEEKIQDGILQTMISKNIVERMQSKAFQM